MRFKLFKVNSLIVKATGAVIAQMVIKAQNLSQ